MIDQKVNITSQKSPKTANSLSFKSYCKSLNNFGWQFKSCTASQEDVFYRVQQKKWMRCNTSVAFMISGLEMAMLGFCNDDSQKAKLNMSKGTVDRQQAKYLKLKFTNLNKNVNVDWFILNA